MRAGAEYFAEPAEPVQRRYEALRAYLVDGFPAEVAGERFGYSKATMYQMAAELRGGRTGFFVSSKPGPKGPRQTATLRSSPDFRLRSEATPYSEGCPWLSSSR